MKDINIISLSEKFDNGKLKWSRICDNNFLINPYSEMAKRTGLNPIPSGNVYSFIDFLDQPYCDISVSGTNLNTTINGGVGLFPMSVGDCFLVGIKGEMKMILITDVIGSIGFSAEGFLFAKCNRVTTKEVEWIGEKTLANAALLIR